MFAIQLLGACGVTAPPPEGILFRSENFFRAIEDGFVVAPVGGITLVTERAATIALFTNEFHAALVDALPGTVLTSPEKTLYLQSRAGEEAQSRFHALMRQIVRGDSLLDEELALVSGDIQHRYLLVSWMHESVIEGIQDTNYDDYGTVDNSMEVRRFTYEEVKGRVEAVVVDLQGNEILWRGAVYYTTARHYGEDGGIRKELERTRALAAVRLANYVAQL